MLSAGNEVEHTKADRVRQDAKEFKEMIDDSIAFSPTYLELVRTIRACLKMVTRNANLERQIAKH